VVACGKFTTELLFTVNRRVHFPSKLALRAGQCAYDGVHREAVPGEQHIDVARGRFPSCGDRSVNEGNPHQGSDGL